MVQQEDGQEADLAKRIHAAQQRVHEALLDNLNSKAALDALLDLIKDTNKYLADRQGHPQGLLVPGLHCVHTSSADKSTKQV